MRKLLALGVLLGTVAACTNMTRTEQAALSAGTVGGVSGLVIGALAGGPIVGLLVGASAGAAYGAMREGD